MLRLSEVLFIVETAPQGNTHFIHYDLNILATLVSPANEYQMLLLLFISAELDCRNDGLKTQNAAEDIICLQLTYMLKIMLCLLRYISSKDFFSNFTVAVDFVVLVIKSGSLNIFSNLYLYVKI